MEKSNKKKHKKTAEEREREHQAFIEKLKQLPPEKLSGVAKWFLESEGKGPTATYDLRAVLR